MSGFVLAPQAMEVMCGYPGDGGSSAGACHGFCQDNQSTSSFNTGCAWPPDKLSHVLSVGASHPGGAYNEIEVSSSKWVANLPRSIEAVWFPQQAAGGSCEHEVRQVHAAFLKRYSLEP